MYNGKTKGVKAEMYAINKAQQRREWVVLKDVCQIRGIAFIIPNPATSKISVKRFDTLQKELIAELGWDIKKFWRARVGESDWRAYRFIQLYRLLYS